jgi:hypothetical protein
MEKLETDMVEKALRSGCFPFDTLISGTLSEEVGRHPRLHDVFCHHLTYVRFDERAQMSGALTC